MENHSNQEYERLEIREVIIKYESSQRRKASLIQPYQFD